MSANAWNPAGSTPQTICFMFGGHWFRESDENADGGRQWCGMVSFLMDVSWLNTRKSSSGSIWRTRFMLQASVSRAHLERVRNEMKVSSSKSSAAEMSRSFSDGIIRGWRNVAQSNWMYLPTMIVNDRSAGRTTSFETGSAEGYRWIFSSSKVHEIRFRHWFRTEWAVSYGRERLVKEISVSCPHGRSKSSGGQVFVKSLSI